LPVAVRTAPNAAAAAPVVKNLLRLAFVKSAGFFDAGFLFESMVSSLLSRAERMFRGTFVLALFLVAKCTLVWRIKSRLDESR
jgi:hypothetical protein